MLLLKEFMCIFNNVQPSQVSQHIVIYAWNGVNANHASSKEKSYYLQ